MALTRHVDGAHLLTTRPAPASLIRRVRQLWGQLGPVRLIALLALMTGALLVARLGWSVPLLADAERALYDARAAVMAPRVEQDPRILLISYVDETLFNTGIRSPVDRAILTRALANIDRMGATAIGVDIVFDSPRPDDAALQAQLRAMQTPTWLAYAEQASNPNAIQYQQQQFLDRFLAAVRTPATQPASVRFRTDADGVMRRWPNRPAHLPDLLANAMVPGSSTAHAYRGALRFHGPLRAEAGAHEPVFAEVPIDSFGAPMDAATLAALAPLVAGRRVLIGGNIVDNDQFETPLSRLPDLQSGERETMTGLAVHAHMLRQRLDGDWPVPLAPVALWLAALLVVAGGALTSLIAARAAMTAAIVAAQLAALLALPFWLEGHGTDTLDLPAFGWALGWLIAFTATGAAARTVGAQQRAFAQSALGKYLPRDIAAEILRNPEALTLKGEKREIFCIFSDLEGFTKLSHAVTPETVARLLNAYLDRLSGVVLAHGGTIDKFVGDAVVAFWGAPIARADDGARAAAAALAMYRAGEEFRRELGDGVPPIGMTRVGLHYGAAIVGNFGGEGRIQYTALGDSMNTASRLEAANKALASRVLISAEAAQHSGRTDLVPLGRITLRGRSQPVVVYEPRPDLPQQQRAQVAALVAAHDAGDMAALVIHATALRAELAQDAAVMQLLGRLDDCAKGDPYVLS